MQSNIIYIYIYTFDPYNSYKFEHQTIFVQILYSIQFEALDKLVQHITLCCSYSFSYDQFQADNSKITDTWCNIQQQFNCILHESLPPQFK